MLFFREEADNSDSEDEIGFLAEEEEEMDDLLIELGAERVRDFVREVMHDDPGAAQVLMDGNPEEVALIEDQYREQHIDNNNDNLPLRRRQRREDVDIYDIPSAQDPNNYNRMLEPEEEKTLQTKFTKFDGSNQDLTWSNKFPNRSGRPSGRRIRSVPPSQVNVELDIVTPLTVWKCQFNIRF